MGRAFAESVPAARAVFDDADRAVGYDLTELCFEGPLERLSETEITQPALVSGHARLPRRRAARATCAPTS